MTVMLGRTVAGVLRPAFLCLIENGAGKVVEEEPTSSRPFASQIRVV